MRDYSKAVSFLEGGLEDSGSKYKAQESLETKIHKDPGQAYKNSKQLLELESFLCWDIWKLYM